MNRTLFAAVLIAGIASAAEPLPPILTEERGTGNERLVARAELSGATVDLSGELKLTLMAEGPAPLRVTLPSPPLSPASAALWKINPIGIPIVEELGDGRERWRQEYRLFPYVSGESVALMPAALSVRAGTAANDTVIEWGNPFSVHVRTSVLQPDIAALRPPVGIELLQQLPTTTSENDSALWLLGILLVAALGTVIVWRYRRRRRAPTPSARETALRDLNALIDRAADPRALQEMADILRRYVALSSDVAAIRLTTEELLVALRQDRRFIEERLGELQAVLEAGDLAKFASQVPIVDAAGFTALHQQAIRFVEQARTSHPLESAEGSLTS